MNVPRYLGQGDRYRIEEQIGRGGMGAVYRAYDKNTDGQVAVKFILDVTSPDAMALFDKEWRILSELQHVNVVSMTDRGEFRDGTVTRPFFVMPFLRGKTLQQRIADSSTPLPVEEIVQIIAAAAAGLNAAHARGVVHRDVKPSNIFTLDSGSVVVIDFGVVHLSETGNVTAIKGTTPYIAPELFDPEKRDVPSPRSDLFSLGVVCYEALTRLQPFSRETTAETVRALLKVIPAPAYELNRDVSLGLSQVVQKAMAKNKNHRYASVIEFAGRLQRAVRNEPLPEFDKALIETRLKVVRDAFTKGQVTAAQELLRGIEEEGFVDPAISNQRQKLDQALQQKWIGEQLESARLHRDIGDFDAALDKLDVILKTAPGNAEAIRERELINNERLQRVLSQADRYMRSHDFESARRSIEEARQIKPKDSATSELLLELTRLEEADRRLAEQKEALFVEAQDSMKAGRATTALHKLDRIRELIHNQGSGLVSDRDAIYVQYHEEILGEYARLRRAFEDAKYQLEQGKFAQVAAVCDEMLATNPGHPLFTGLKLQAEDRERQTRLECVEGVCAALANEPDLERQVGIVQDALNRFNGEPQLTEMLRNVKGRRGLIGALVASAREAEEAGEYITALDNWEAIREFHPNFPGLNREMARVERRREEQIRTEKKSERIEEVERLVRLADYDNASALCRAALAEFPGDAELTDLMADTADRAARANEAREILAKSRELARAGRGEEMLALLRRAHSLDRNNQEIRQFLGVALLDRAQTALEIDWTAAEQLLGEARELIPNDPAVKSIATLVADRKQREAVETCLAEARRRALDGDTRGASEQIERALKLYPNDRRLVAERTKLLKQSGIESTPTPVPKAAAAGEQAVAAAAAGPSGAAAPPQDESIFMVQVSGQFPVPVATNAQAGPTTIEKATPAAPVPGSRGEALIARFRAAPRVFIVAAAALAIIIAAISWAVIARQSRPKPPQVVRLDVTTLPDGAQISVDGKKAGTAPFSAKLKPGEHVIQASLTGYEPLTQRVKAEGMSAAVPMTLKAIPLQISLAAGNDPATVSLDDQTPVEAKPGSTAAETAVPGSHALKIVSKAGESVGHFAFQPGEPPKVIDLTVQPGASVLVMGSFDGKTRMALQGAQPAAFSLDKQEYKLTSGNPEISLPRGTHEIAANGHVFPVVIGSQHDLHLVFLTAATTPEPVARTAAEWSSDTRSLMAKKKYVAAYEVVRRWVQAQPNNSEAAALKRQLESIRDLDPDRWK